MGNKEQIEKEAKRYSETSWGGYYNDKHPDCAISDTFGQITEKDFIRGVNSAIAERIKIEYAISVLEEVEREKKFFNKITIDTLIENKITELKKQLK